MIELTAIQGQRIVELLRNYDLMLFKHGWEQGGTRRQPVERMIKYLESEIKREAAPDGQIRD